MKGFKNQRDLLPYLEIPNHCPIPTFTSALVLRPSQLAQFCGSPLPNQAIILFSSSFHLPSQLPNPCSPVLLPFFVRIIPLLNYRSRYLTGSLPLSHSKEHSWLPTQILRDIFVLLVKY